MYGFAIRCGLFPSIRNVACVLFKSSGQFLRAAHCPTDVCLCSIDIFQIFLITPVFFSACSPEAPSTSLFRCKPRKLDVGLHGWVSTPGHSRSLYQRYTVYERGFVFQVIFYLAVVMEAFPGHLLLFCFIFLLWYVLGFQRGWVLFPLAFPKGWPTHYDTIDEKTPPKKKKKTTTKCNNQTKWVSVIPFVNN